MVRQVWKSQASTVDQKFITLAILSSTFFSSVPCSSVFLHSSTCKCAVSFLLTSSSFVLPLFSFSLSHLSFLPSHAVVNPGLWQVVQEGMGCLHGWPVGLCVSSVSKTRRCFRVLLGADSFSLASLSTQFFPVSVSISVAPSQSLSAFCSDLFHCTS